MIEAFMSWSGVWSILSGIVALGALFWAMEACTWRAGGVALAAFALLLVFGNDAYDRRKAEYISACLAETTLRPDECRVLWNGNAGALLRAKFAK